MAIFRPLAARSPQNPPGPAWRDKVLADNADAPDDADEPDDLDECDKSWKLQLASWVVRELAGIREPYWALLKECNHNILAA